MVIYLAGPLSSRTAMAALAQQLERAGHTLSWPGALFSEHDIREFGRDAPEIVFESCRIAMERCSCVVTCLDGGRVDGCTAWEVGYARARGTPVYGLRNGAGPAGKDAHDRGNTVVAACFAGAADNIATLLAMLDEAGGSRAVAHEALRRG